MTVLLQSHILSFLMRVHALQWSIKWRDHVTPDTNPFPRSSLDILISIKVFPITLFNMELHFLRLLRLLWSLLDSRESITSACLDSTKPREIRQGNELDVGRNYHLCYS